MAAPLAAWVAPSFAWSSGSRSERTTRASSMLRRTNAKRAWTSSPGAGDGERAQVPLRLGRSLDQHRVRLRAGQRQPLQAAEPPADQRAVAQAQRADVGGQDSERLGRGRRRLLEDVEPQHRALQPVLLGCSGESWALHRSAEFPPGGTHAAAARRGPLEVGRPGGVERQPAAPQEEPTRRRRPRACERSAVSVSGAPLHSRTASALVSASTPARTIQGRLAAVGANATT